MSPRAWAVWTAAALAVALGTTNPVYRGLVLLIGLNVVIALRRPDARLRPVLIALAVGAVVAAILNMLLSHSGDHELFAIAPQLPGIGGPVTVESAVYGIDVGLGIAAAVLVVAPLSLVLHPHDLIDALPRALQRTGALVGSALNLVPAVGRKAVAIAEAQRMRGAAATRIRDWPALATPIVLAALDDSLQVAEAMEARGFGAGPRTQYTSPRMHAPDIAVVAAAFVSLALVIDARVTGTLTDWYPFPAVTTPALALGPVIACALLTAPLIAWRRS